MRIQYKTRILFLALECLEGASGVLDTAGMLNTVASPSDGTGEGACSLGAGVETGSDLPTLDSESVACGSHVIKKSMKRDPSFGSLGLNLTSISMHFHMIQLIQMRFQRCQKAQQAFCFQTRFSFYQKP